MADTHEERIQTVMNLLLDDQTFIIEFANSALQSGIVRQRLSIQKGDIDAQFRLQAVLKSLAQITREWTVTRGWTVGREGG